MNAQTIRKQRDEVDRAPALAPDARLDALAELVDRWRDPNGMWQRELSLRLADHSGFDPAMTRSGIAAGFGAFSGAALRKLAERELGVLRESTDSASTVLAGAIPMPSLVAIVSPLLAGASLLIKQSAADRVTPGLILDSLAEFCPALARRAAIVELDNDDRDAIGVLMAADVVELTGSDESVALYAEHAAKTTRVLRHGHRFSVAIVGPDATRGEALTAFADTLASDIALWDQLGCLSPVALFVCDPERDAGARVAAAVAGALVREATARPRGVLPLGTRARFRDAIDVAALRGAQTWTSETRDWCVVLENDAALRDAPLYRFLRVHPSASLDHALGALHQERRHLAAVAIAGLGRDEAETGARLRELGASRICAPGTLQCPPFAWPRDGIPVLGAFARCGDKAT